MSKDFSLYDANLVCRVRTGILSEGLVYERQECNMRSKKIV